MASSPRVTFEIGEYFHSYSDLEALEGEVV